MRPVMPRSLDVIIPVRNGASTIGAQLDALAVAHERVPGAAVRVVVADNGSCDDTVDVVRKHRSGLIVDVVDASQVPGPSAARNAGVAACAAPWLAFCDADDAVDVGWLDAIVRRLESGAELIGGLLSYALLSDETAMASRGARSVGVVSVLGFLPFAHSANLAVTRAVFDELGGFDPALAVGEDIDFSWRAQLGGHELVVALDAVVHYRLRTGFRAVWGQAAGYGSAEVTLERRFADRGVQQPTAADLLRDLWWLVSRAPLAYRRSRRAAWVRRAARQWGRLRARAPR